MSFSERTFSESKQIKRVTYWGLAVNFLLSLIKFAAGILASSQAVVADAVHSLSDSATDIALLIGVRYWTLPPDKSHPHGHRRIETLITTFIGILLGAVAVGLAYNALSTLYGKHDSQPCWPALAAALLSLIAKEILYRWNIKVGENIHSTALIANAWHHRSDALSSIPAALAVGGAMINPAWGFLDHVGAVVVAVLIMQAAWRITNPAISELTDAGASPETCEKILRIVMETQGVLASHHIRTRLVGNFIHVDLHIKVDPNMTVYAGHEISEHVHDRLVEADLHIADAVVHLEPHKTSPDRN